MYDAQAHTLTWADVPLAAGRKRKYSVKVEVLPTATGPLVFSAACPNCVALNTQSSVQVRSLKGRRGLHWDGDLSFVFSFYALS